MPTYNGFMMPPIVQMTTVEKEAIPENQATQIPIT